MAYTTIDNPAEHFETVLYTGNGASEPSGAGSVQTVSSLDFAPDLVWIKDRTQAHNHNLMDTTRAAPNILMSDASNAEITDSSDALTSFTPDGFVIGDNGEGTQSLELNKLNNTYIAWNWKANGGSRTTNGEVGNNPAGGYQANTTAGFSIVDYVGTGAAGTMAHGLGAAPDFILFKNLDVDDAWAVYHSANTAAPETDYMVLSTDTATVDDDAFWNDTAPTSSVFTVNTDHSVNADGERYIAYCLTSIQGYSKFGGYTGNGNADGPYIHLGFKPAFIWLKNTDTTDSWYLYDIKRAETSGNEVDIAIGTATNLYEFDTSSDLDFLANGFKNRGSGPVSNGDGNTIIYMAFAESPFVTSGGVPCTAR